MLGLAGLALFVDAIGHVSVVFQDFRLYTRLSELKPKCTYAIAYFMSVFLSGSVRVPSQVPMFMS